jgi:hypothetical protein
MHGRTVLDPVSCMQQHPMHGSMQQLLLVVVLMVLTAASTAQQPLIKDLIRPDQKILRGVQPVVSVEEVDRARKGTHCQV